MAPPSSPPQVVDPNTNHTYYWNPANNEVSWTLPENSVITDDPPPKPPESASGKSSGDGASSDGTYADYYAYYAQALYGVDASKQQQQQQQQSKQSGAVQTGAKGKASDAAGKGGGTVSVPKEDGEGKTPGATAPVASEEPVSGVSGQVTLIPVWCILIRAHHITHDN